MAWYCRILAGVLLGESVLALFLIGLNEGIPDLRKDRDHKENILNFLGTPYVRYIQLIVGFTVIIVKQFTNEQDEKEKNEEVNNHHVTMPVIDIK